MDTSQANNQKVAIVTGGSSGIGYATSLLLARNGNYTYASARNIDKSSSLQSIAEAERLRLKPIQLDVTDDSSVKAAVEKIMSEKGRIDVRKTDLELDRKRRNQILDAAPPLFLQLGYAKTSMDYVAINTNL